MQIHISNLDRITTEEDLQKLFEDFGEVVSAEINEEPDPGKLTFSGYVEMQYEEDAEEAIAELKGEKFDGRIISVAWKTELEHPADLDESSSAQEEEKKDDDEMWSGKKQGKIRPRRFIDNDD